MFFNSLKAKSIEGKLNELIKDRSYVPSGKKPVAIAVLQERLKPFSQEFMENLSFILAGKQVIVDLLEYVEKVEKADKENWYIFSNKAIGWNGALKGKGVKQFTQKQYDILISYYTSEELSLQMVTATSQAILKVGISEQFGKMNDLTIVSEIGQEEVFIKELQKYLKILKIIN